MARARVFSHAYVSATFDIEGEEENVKRQCLVITNAPVTDKSETVGNFGKSTMHVVVYEYLFLESLPTPLVHRLQIGNRKFCVKSRCQQRLRRVEPHAPPRRAVGFLCGRTAFKGLR
jgi:hypothetical protein